MDEEIKEQLAQRLDETILKHVRSDWLKVARVVALAMKDVGFAPHDADV